MPNPRPAHREPVDTSGYAFVRHQAWHKDRRYTEVWASHEGKSWTMLGMERIHG